MSRSPRYLSCAEAGRISSAILVVLLTGAGVPSLRAQVATASINGTVTDSSGAVIPGAKVALKNVATNVERSTATNDTGNYVLVNILPGRYTLRVSKEGFATVTQPEFDLAVNQTTAFDFSLQVGQATQTITVEATATGIQTSTSELGSVIGTRAVGNLPLNGRNFTQMLNLTPGVSTVNVTQNATNKQFQGNPIGSFSFPSINGQTNRSNFFLVDGLNDQESFSSTYSVPPIIDDIQEFKVDSHNDQAQFGGVLGGVVNVVTKSGTNSFRGEAWEFLRNNKFDARGALDTAKLQLQQNAFGANIGGPVILPHYNGRNRTFFFGSYEGVRRHEGNSNRNLVPTPAEINGDFSDLKVPLYNPWSTSGPGIRDPFRCVGGAPAPLIPGTKVQDQTVGTTCKILPAALIDPNMLKVAQMVYGPLQPNFIGVIKGINFQQILLNTQSPNTYNFRVDEQLGQKDALWGRFSHTSSPRNVPNIFGAANANVYNAHTLAASWSHTFGPSALLSVQVGRNYGFSTAPTLLPDSVSQQLVQAGNWDPSFDCSFVRGPRQCYFIGANISGIASLSESVNPAVIADIWEWKANFVKTHGRHNFSMGLDFNSNGFQQTFNSGNENYAATQTALSGSGGFGLASFLLGVPDGATLRNVFETEHGGWVDGFYFQDQWKVTDRLTVNWGARYDVTFYPIFGSLADKNDRIGNVDLNKGTYVLKRTAPDCATTGNKPPCIPGGALPANVVLSPDGRFWHNSYDNLQPRLGTAYRLTNKTVLRASFGRFFENWAAVIQIAQNQQGTWPSTGQLINGPNLNNSGPPTIPAENVFLGASTTPSPSPFQNPGLNNWYVDPNIQNPYSYQWNFGVQQALTPSTTLTVNYVGSTDHRLDVGITGNQALFPVPSSDPRSKQNPSASCSASATCLATVATSGRYAFPYIPPIHYDKSIGRGWYHALQVSLDKRASHGLSYLLAYTWSKTLSVGADEWFGTGTNGTSIQDPWHINNDKGLAGFDVPQIFTASWVYELPFGKGRKFQSGNGAVDAVLGGWQLNGITNFTSGTLFNVVASNSLPNTNSASAERANLIGNPRVPNPTPAQWFNPAAFVPPTSGTYGNFGRNVLRGDGRANLDLSIFRSFQITESKRLEFRAEAFNFTNSPIWGNPNANISTDVAKGTFGVVNTTAPGYAPRQIQFALKLYY